MEKALSLRGKWKSSLLVRTMAKALSLRGQLNGPSLTKPSQLTPSSRKPSHQLEYYSCIQHLVMLCDTAHLVGSIGNSMFEWKHCVAGHPRKYQPVMLTPQQLHAVNLK